MGASSRVAIARVAGNSGRDGKATGRVSSAGGADRGQKFWRPYVIAGS